MHSILLVGAALVGLPILLHLIMKQEPKRLSFPAFRFLTQKLKTNQRKLRLRHFILLALRMLLIGLFCLALYNVDEEEPVAVVVVLDTSPSMGFTVNDKTRLEEACQQALDLLGSMSPQSRVAIVETGDGAADWFRSVSDAQAHLRGLVEPIKQARSALQDAVRRDRPRKELEEAQRNYEAKVLAATAGARPVSTALATAYQLLTASDPETATAKPLPKYVVVFTDRTAACWDAARVDDLKKLREKIPDPKPEHAVVDVGIDQPVNVAILAAEMKPQVIPANQPAVVTVTVAATGSPDAPPVDASVLARLD